MVRLRSGAVLQVDAVGEARVLLRVGCDDVTLFGVDDVKAVVHGSDHEKVFRLPARRPVRFSDLTNTPNTAAHVQGVHRLSR